MKPKWKETAKDRQTGIAITTELRVDDLRIIVTRMIHLDGWYMSVPALRIDAEHLEAGKLDSAQIEAVDRVRSTLESYLKAIESC